MCLTLTWTAHIIEDTTLLEALHVQLVTEHIFNKLEVSRLDSTLSVFVIYSYIQTLSWCQIVVRIKLLPIPYEQDFAVNFYSDRTHIYILAFQEAFQQDLKYSDFF